jgi:diketogulonate reductase-like aldo/keto reductase
VLRLAAFAHLRSIAPPPLTPLLLLTPFRFCSPLPAALIYSLPGKAIKGCREKFTIATKCGIVKTDSGLIFDGSRKHVREACEASLKRLGTDYIDLYYLHRRAACPMQCLLLHRVLLCLCEASLKRLGTDYIDLCYLHRWGRWLFVCHFSCC